MTTEPLPQLLTVAEVATRLGCSERHIYTEIARGKFDEIVDISGAGTRSKTRIPEPALARYIAARTRSIRKASA